MSVQFGIWNQDGRPVDEVHFEKAKALLAPYGPDGSQSYRQANIAINYQAFHTTKESRAEAQPHITQSGAVITWDGRLDNRQELISQCNDSLKPNATDVEIVAAAYDNWGACSFGRLIGDWALSAWNPVERSLVLAKDLMGTRHLYYTSDKDQIRWSTILDPLVLLADKTFALEEEYIAGWFSFFPTSDLTPYVGIRAVPPSSFVLIQRCRHRVTKYWDFDPGKRIRYRSDAEYEEHFRAVFRESVKRRLRSHAPIVAELSGGMDSSSIVCVADTIIADPRWQGRQVETISYYDDSEPNWNERPYFRKVEEKRGKVGRHVNVPWQDILPFQRSIERFVAVPAADNNKSLESAFADYIRCLGTRVVLSGIGGDEVTGGVPTAAPELEDLLASAQFRDLARKLKAWALNKRKPWMQLLWEAARRFLPPTFIGMPRHKRPASWVNPQFAKRHYLALRGYERRLEIFGPSPTFQENIAALNALRRQLGCEANPAEPCYEKRYPYLDRDLLAFAYAIPREQLVRPGQRRSLMRRALTGIVPDEILNRKRKAFVARAPVTAMSTEYRALSKMAPEMVLTTLDIISPGQLSKVLDRLRAGQEIQIVPLLRMLQIESWLRNLRLQGILKERPYEIRQRRPAYGLS